MQLVMQQLPKTTTRHCTGNIKSQDVFRRPSHRQLGITLATASSEQQQPPAAATRREALLALTAVTTSITLGSTASPALAVADDFVNTPSGLKVQDLRKGSGDLPKPGQRCVVHWSGYTIGYQGKRIGNTTVKDEPYEFVLGKHEAIPAFEEAVAGMQAGGVRRIEVSGDIPSLMYPRNRSERYKSEFTYRYGPQPDELGGQRALDFVLDNSTLPNFNRTLLFDIKLLSVRD